MILLHPNRDEIFAGVRDEVAACLSVDIEEVTQEANFCYDLGGESLDDLDISRRLEKRFEVFLPLLRVQEAWQFDNEGLSDQALNWWQTEFPMLDWQARFRGIPLRHPYDLWTIGFFTDVIYCSLMKKHSKKSAE